MSITEDSRPTKITPPPMLPSSAGPDSLGGHSLSDIQTVSAAEGNPSPQANVTAMPNAGAPAGCETSRSQRTSVAQKEPAAADSSLNGHASAATQISVAVEGETSRSQSRCDTQACCAAAADLPGGQNASGTQAANATGDQVSVLATDGSVPIALPPVRDQVPPAARLTSSPILGALLADPLLALAADVLGDLEKVRIANENRLRQLTRSAEDSDGETRGFGLDESHPDVARLAALVGMLADAEHKATLNLQRVMRKHPLGPWVAAQKGIGEKQGARLLAAIGDPYIRPEITREDGTVEPARPRMVSELWAYCGYHVVPADQHNRDAQHPAVGGELNGSDPGHLRYGTHGDLAGVAPKKQRGQRANWSATAKMRAFLVAESCIKQSGTPYRAVYDATRQKYAEAVHAAECVRCGPKNKPAQPGSPLSDGHKHARALRAVAKEILRGLWREAKRIHEASVSGQGTSGTQRPPAADGAGLPLAINAAKSRGIPPTALNAQPEGFAAA